MRGGARKGAGRKPGPAPQTLARTIRWNPDEWSEVVEAADKASETTSEFVRTAAIERARVHRENHKKH